MTYAWVITQGLDNPYDDPYLSALPSRVGVSGPSSATAEDIARALNTGAFFRLLDDDRHPYYIGRCWSTEGPDSQDMFGPLPDYGGPADTPVSSVHVICIPCRGTRCAPPRAPATGPHVGLRVPRVAGVRPTREGKPVPSNDSTELWFPVTDLLPLVEQCLSAPGHTADAQHGDLPALHLTAQGDALFYLATNAVPALLVDAFDPTSRQRVYALGYGHGAGSLTHPADADRYRPATQLASIPLVSGGGRFGNLADRLRLAAGIGCDWFVLALHPDGRLDVSVRPTPRPSPAARRRHARLELAGLPGRWPGQFVTNAAHDGWLLARFTCEVGQQIATAVADLAATAVVPHPLTTVELADTPTAQRSATAPAGVVGVDPEGFYRVGVGWPWVSLDLLPNGLLVPYTGPIRSGIDPAQGQYAFTGMGHLMWLDDNQNLVLRPAGDDSAGSYARSNTPCPTPPPGRRRSPGWPPLSPRRRWRR